MFSRLSRKKVVYQLSRSLQVMIAEKPSPQAFLSHPGSEAAGTRTQGWNSPDPPQSPGGRPSSQPAARSAQVLTSVGGKWTGTYFWGSRLEGCWLQINTVCPFLGTFR